MTASSPLVTFLTREDLQIDYVDGTYFFCISESEKLPTLERVIYGKNIGSNTEMHNGRECFSKTGQNIENIDDATKYDSGLQIYGEKLHFARFPKDRDKLIKDPNAKIDKSETTIHFKPDVFVKQHRQDIGSVDSTINALKELKKLLTHSNLEIKYKKNAKGDDVYELCVPNAILTPEVAKLIHSKLNDTKDCIIMNEIGRNAIERETSDRYIFDSTVELQNYGEQLHFAKFPEDRDKLIKDPNAKINKPETIHFKPDVFVKQHHHDIGSVGSTINTLKELLTHPDLEIKCNKNVKGNDVYELCVPNAILTPEVAKSIYSTLNATKDCIIMNDIGLDAIERETLDRYIFDSTVKLQNYGEKLHFAKYPYDKFTLRENFNATINKPESRHFSITEYVNKIINKIITILNDPNLKIYYKQQEWQWQQDSSLSASHYHHDQFLFTYDNTEDYSKLKELSETLQSIDLIRPPEPEPIEFANEQRRGIVLGIKDIKHIDEKTQNLMGKLAQYGAKVHFARYPKDRDKLEKDPKAKITQVTIHFAPAIFPEQVHQKPGSYDSAITADTLAPSKPTYFCIPSHLGDDISKADCEKSKHTALETKYKNKYNYKYIKYKMKYLNLKLLNK